VVGDLVAGCVRVVAAGGLSAGWGRAAALMLGASGILLGPGFLGAAVAAAADAAKERIRVAGGDDTLRSIVFDISRENVWPGSFTGRCVRNAHLERWLGRESELLRHQREEAINYAAARSAGDFDIAAVIAGESAGLVRDIRPARELVERIAQEASELLARGSSRPSQSFRAMS
jgi:nitronate monooxygenase